MGRQQKSEAEKCSCKMFTPNKLLLVAGLSRIYPSFVTLFQLAATSIKWNLTLKLEFQSHPLLLGHGLGIIIPSIV